MQQIAVFSLLLAAFCAGYAVIAASIAVKSGSANWMESAHNAIYALTGLLTLDVFLLLYFLLARDFRLLYVANFTNIALSPMYVVSALWAGQEGSLLLWAWILSLCCVFFLHQAKKRGIQERYGLQRLPRSLRQHLPRHFSDELSYAMIALAVILGFFLMQFLLYSNPFRVLDNAPLDGQGMNPLLQTPYMAAHPPILFLGYAGFAIPFALAFAALCSGKMSKAAIVDMRRWTLFAWYFLGMGILLGAHWAYLELGWGGYWGWDPVENASFIPWVTSTALLHTLILQQRKGSLKRWNLFLSVSTFVLCIFGTFITRSGILSSVHAYAESPAAISFLLFLTVVLGIFALLSAFRWKHFQSPEITGGHLSKGNSFLLSVQLFMGLGFAVLFGTIYPLLAEFMTGRQRVIGLPFFNRVSIPLGLLLLALMGLCQALPWKTVSFREFFRLLSIPFAIAAGITFSLAMLGLRHWLVLLTCGLGILVLMTLLIHVRQLLLPFSFFHLGTAVLLVGIAVSSGYKSEFQTELLPGESFEAGAFRFHYREKRVEEHEAVASVTAEVDVYKYEQFLTTLFPEKRFYITPDSEEPLVTTEVGLYSSLRTDVYSILAGWDENDLTTFRFIVSPMILWIWLGGFMVFTLGMLISLKRKH
ncbi:MAG: heme lyase CcmF/NrfE family subunit [bacterium]|nr:heme lyase CcmF/NrfE family subunit [bacterium]